jgi:hypothetical protein
VDLLRALDSINREALWYKIRKKGLSPGIMECIRSMYDVTELREIGKRSSEVADGATNWSLQPEHMLVQHFHR